MTPGQWSGAAIGLLPDDKQPLARHAYSTRNDKAKEPIAELFLRGIEVLEI